MAEDQVKEADKQAENEPQDSGEKKTFISVVSGMSAKQRKIIIFAVLVVVAFLFDRFMLNPLNKELDKISQVVTEKEASIPERLMVLKRKNRILNTRDKLRDYVTDAGLAQEEEIARLLREIESVSQRSGLFISNINPVESKDLGNNMTELTVELEGAGSIGNIKKFIMNLERSNAPVTVSAMNLRSQGPDNPEMRYRVTVQKLGIK